MKTKLYFPATFIIILFLLLSSANAYKGKTLHGKVMQVKDGDTVVISPIDGGQFLTCRLSGIDTPEKTHGRKAGQPYGEEAAKELKHLILGQPVEVTTTGAKTYKRDVCIIKKDGADINLDIKIDRPTEQDLQDQKVRLWGRWEKEISRFDWHYDETEECYLLEGRVVVETPGRQG